MNDEPLDDHPTSSAPHPTEPEQFGAFEFYWELTHFQNRLRVGMLDHTSWNTLLRLGKLTIRDFPDEED